VVWDEIKRILAGAEEDSKSSLKSSLSSGETDQEIGSFAPAEVEAEAALPGDVSVAPFPPVEGQELTVRYEGLLAREGAAGISLHCGYGEGSWSNVHDVAMTPVGEGRWQATVFSDRPGRFNFCFRDSAGNWDNRGGQNWSVDVLPS